MVFPRRTFRRRRAPFRRATAARRIQKTWRRRRTTHPRRSLKPANTRPTLFKELIRTEYRMSSNADGMTIVNGPSTVALNKYPDQTAFEDIDQSPQYATLWKMYQIKGVKYQFFPFHTESVTNDTDPAGVTNNPLKWFWYKYQKAGQIEPNPVAPITTQLYNQGPKFKQFDRPITLYFGNPRAVQAGWTDSSASAGAIEGSLPTDTDNRWHSTDAYPNVQHYGLLFGLMNCTPNAEFTVTCIKTVYFKLQDQR